MGPLHDVQLSMWPPPGYVLSALQAVRVLAMSNSGSESVEVWPMGTTLLAQEAMQPGPTSPPQ